MPNEMKPNRLICFLYDDAHRIRNIAKAMQHLQEYFTIIEVHSTHNMITICELLSSINPDIRAFILSHEGIENKSEDIKVELSILKKKLPLWEKKRIRFSTGVGNDIIKNITEITPPFAEQNSFLLRELFSNLEYHKDIKNLIFVDQLSDWRLEDLFEQFSKAELQKIVSKAVRYEGEHHKLKVIKPGLSGAVLLKVTYLDKDRGRSLAVLLKLSPSYIDMNAEQSAATLFDQVRLNNNKFIWAIPDSRDSDNFFSVNGWHVLVYPFQPDKITLREYLRKKSDSTLEVVELAVTEFEEFQETLFEYKYERGIPPFTYQKNTDNEEDATYLNVGVKQNQVNKIHQVLDRLTYILGQNKFLNTLGKSNRNIKAFVNFLDNISIGKYKSIDIEGSNRKEILVPLGIVHGDFHTANILVNSTGNKSCYIDYANTNDKKLNKHAFLDIGKLSTDMEISIFSDPLITANKDCLAELMDYHKDWLNFQHNSNTDNTELKRIYEVNTYLRNYLIEKHGHKMDEENIIRQFYMVRLHYFLKAISYDYEVREKLLFFIRASIDILEYLIKDKK